jgi:hypothetical protein
VRRPDVGGAICVEGELEWELGSSRGSAHCKNEEEEGEEEF